MLLNDKLVEVGICGENREWYESKGYDIPLKKGEKGKMVVARGTKIKVHPADLSLSSKIKVPVTCDKCGEELNVVFHSYRLTYEKWGEYLCKKCCYEHNKKTNMERYGAESYMHTDEGKARYKATCLEKYGAESPLQNAEIRKKHRETCLERYGVENVSQLDEVKKKKASTTLQNYGVENPNQSLIVREKTKQTCLEKYGCESTTQAESVKEKIRETNLKRYGFENVSQNEDIKKKKVATLSKNDNVATSLQQKYIEDVLKNKYELEFNHPYSSYLLDILIKDYNIDLEYDGSGHWLSIQFGLTKEEFDKKEATREMVIRRHGGYNIVRFICPNDLLPSDDKMIELIEYANEYFVNTGHTWIQYFIEDGKMRNAENLGKVDFDYGELWNARNLCKKVKKEVMSA